MSMKIKSLVCMMMMVAALAATAQAVVLIDEGFESGDLSGGTGLGAWSVTYSKANPWSVYDAAGTTDPSMLPAFDGVTTGDYYARRGGANGSSEMNSAISADLVTPGTVYFSLLINAYDFNAKNNFEMILGTDALLPGNGAALMMTAGGEGIGLGLSNTTLHACIYDESGGVTTGTLSTGSIVVADTLATAGTTFMVVGEIIWGTTTDTLNLYNITDVSAPLPAAFATVSGNLNESAFDLLAIADRRNASIDEIRFATEIVELGVLLPDVNAGLDQEIYASSTLLEGTATDHSDPYATLTYAWTADDAGVSFGTPTDPNTTVTLPDYGLYVLTLAVTSSSGGTGTDTVSVFWPDPGDASAPVPADGATGVSVTPTLSWTAGADAVTRDVWFGTDPDALVRVLDDTTETSYTPGTLIKGQTYYWAVDETDSSAVIHEGFTWSFTTIDAPATTSWTGGGASSLWNDEANWDLGAPGLGSVALIHDANAPAVIDATVVAAATGIGNAHWGIAAAVTEPNVDATVLEMTGGTLELGPWALGNQGPAILNISGGTITVNGRIYLGDSVDIGDVTLNMSGGTIRCNDELRLYDRTNNSRTTLTGDAVISAANIRLWSAAGRQNIIDFAGGKLLLDGDQTALLNSYVEEPVVGGFIAYDGTGTVMVSYDPVADVSTVEGCPLRLNADFSDDCAVASDDLQLQVENWLYVTPAEAVWSFDMATDPVGTGDFDLVVRGDDPANANYTMGDDTGTGTLEITGNLLLDQQYAGASGKFDTDVHYEIKSTSENAVDLWIYMATSAVEGGQSAVGISTMLDPNDTDPNIVTQTVEIWGGLARQQGGYTPAVTATGFDRDAYLTIDVNYDYDTDTYDWSVTDGTITQSDTGVAYTNTGNGDGGSWTLASLATGGNTAPGTALVDQLDVTIAGSAPVVKPGDADTNGKVDLLDFALLAAEWLLDGGL